MCFSPAEVGTCNATAGKAPKRSQKKRKFPKKIPKTQKHPKTLKPKSLPKDSTKRNKPCQHQDSIVDSHHHDSRFCLGTALAIHRRRSTFNFSRDFMRVLWSFPLETSWKATKNHYIIYCIKSFFSGFSVGSSLQTLQRYPSRRLHQLTLSEELANLHASRTFHSLGIQSFGFHSKVLLNSSSFFHIISFWRKQKHTLGLLKNPRTNLKKVQKVFKKGLNKY